MKKEWIYIVTTLIVILGITAYFDHRREKEISDLMQGMMQEAVVKHEINPLYQHLSSERKRGISIADLRRNFSAIRTLGSVNKIEKPMCDVAYSYHRKTGLLKRADCHQTIQFNRVKTDFHAIGLKGNGPWEIESLHVISNLPQEADITIF